MSTSTEKVIASGVLPVLDATFRQALPELVQDWQAVEVPAPSLVALNAPLAAALGLDAEALASDDGVAVLAGNAVPEGSFPVAMGYAGHQFGGYSPRLGDGRALLLGELVDAEGARWDLHLKGSGRTPYARGGDGKATLGPMLREFLFAEAMHALGVPTGRALAVVTTGEWVQRDVMEPGAVLTRVASSHLRVGTFEYAARFEDRSVLRRLADLAIDRHHPEVASSPTPYLDLFEAVVESQAALVADWMLLGFIHGVMNTDNTTISGETIDYGPCAFMDRYDPATVYSSIDHGGRYAYGNQPGIMQWNLARLAETLLSLIDDDRERAAETVTEVLGTFADRYRRHWESGMRAKLGLTETLADDAELAAELVEVMHAAALDHTATYRALAAGLRGDHHWFAAELEGDRIAAWSSRWRQRLEHEDATPAEIADAMDAVNPVHVPRNHLVDESLRAAVAGDLDPFRALLDHVTSPYEARPDDRRFEEPAPPEFDARFRTFCGT